ncbi:NAD(P)/FAD-dependent oxidoreductase [Amycolatopsis sp. cg5]|uniref:NAD(P)/FAD-dependent oxidoreductase n=1 Tax=Amycolatopsis sp. cg5 TaxID=3238802 RepID=UPI0035239BC2
MSKAVVIGGGLAGMLASAALAKHVDEVVVIESDQLPTEPRPRRGLPQGHHSHMLMGGGAIAMDALAPGTTDALFAAGAHRRGLPTDALTLTSTGWYPRVESPAFVITCSRDLIDHVLRTQVLKDTRITVWESTKAVGLVGDATKVTGVRVERDGGEEEVVSADFVVDAAGRRSKAPQWLVELGLPQVEEELVDSGLAYAGRIFTAPEGAGDDMPVVIIQPQPGTGQPGRGATLLPIEGGRWIVTMTGTRGGQPSTADDEFIKFAQSMRHPIVANLVEKAVPTGEVRPYRGTGNWRRFYDRLPVPEGFVAIGDSAAALNPVYAHGMSVSAQGALALRGELDRIGLKPGLAEAAQNAIAQCADWPWAMAAGQDRAFPDVKSNVEVEFSEEEAAFGMALAQQSIIDPEVCKTTLEVYTLMASPAKMAELAAKLFAPDRPTGPVLSEDEAIAQFPELRDLHLPHSATSPHQADPN